jgi:hypothetical protein
MLPDIPNDMALFIALIELNNMNKLRSDLNNIDKDAGQLLDPFIDNLRRIITEYKST